MTDNLELQENKRFYFSWLIDILIYPRKCFKQISSISRPLWLTPILILSILVVLNIFIAGKINTQAMLIGEVTYPPDYDYYTPEQQAQFMQAIQYKQGPVFVYVIPLVSSLLRIWIIWLLLGGLLHLATILLGGRGSAGLSLNIVAWSSVPLILREIIRIAYMLVTQNLLIYTGLSGFSPQGESGLFLFVSQILKLVDIYFIWQIALLITGVRISTGLTKYKSIFCVFLTILVIVLIQSGLAYLGNMLGNLNITRPFFF